MNWYIDKYKTLIDEATNEKQRADRISRARSCWASIVIGKSFGQTVDEYLADKPDKREFGEWVSTI